MEDLRQEWGKVCRVLNRMYMKYSMISCKNVFFIWIYIEQNIMCFDLAGEDNTLRFSFPLLRGQDGVMMCEDPTVNWKKETVIYLGYISKIEAYT